MEQLASWGKSAYSGLTSGDCYQNLSLLVFFPNNHLDLISLVLACDTNNNTLNTHNNEQPAAALQSHNTDASPTVAASTVPITVSAHSAVVETPPEIEIHKSVPVLTAAMIHTPPREMPPPPPPQRPLTHPPTPTPTPNPTPIAPATIAAETTTNTAAITTPTATNPTITSTNNPITSLPVAPVVPPDSNHELETSLSTVSASTSSPSSSPVAASKALVGDDSVNNNAEPSYQNTSESMAIAMGGVASAATPAAKIDSVEENNNSRTSGAEKLQNGHGKGAVTEEVDGVPKSPSVDTRNNNTAALGDAPGAAAPAAALPSTQQQPAAAATGAVSKEGNNLSHKERLYHNLYNNQEMVVRMMTANLGRRSDDEEDEMAMQLQQHPMYDIPVSPPAGEMR